METITKKQQMLNDCKEAMGRDNAGITLFIKMPTGEEEMIHNPCIATKMAYIEKAYDEDLRLKTCQDIQIVEYRVHFPMDEVMDFGVALMNLKEGHHVARKGWNGKGMFLVMQPGSQVPAERMRADGMKEYYKDAGIETVTIAPHIDLKAADGTYVTGWLASQTDLLAEDWVILS